MENKNNKVKTMKENIKEYEKFYNEISENRKKSKNRPVPKCSITHTLCASSRIELIRKFETQTGKKLKTNFEVFNFELSDGFTNLWMGRFLLIEGQVENDETFESVIYLYKDNSFLKIK